MAVDMSTRAPHIYAELQEWRESQHKQVINRTQELEFAIIGRFLRAKEHLKENRMDDSSVSLHTWMITSGLKKQGYNYCPTFVRNTCRSLVKKGILEVDEKYSAVNSISWRYIG